MGERRKEKEKGKKVESQGRKGRGDRGKQEEREVKYGAERMRKREKRTAVQSGGRWQ